MTPDRLDTLRALLAATERGPGPIFAEQWLSIFPGQPLPSVILCDVPEHSGEPESLVAIAKELVAEIDRLWASARQVACGWCRARGIEVHWDREPDGRPPRDFLEHLGTCEHSPLAVRLGRLEAWQGAIRRAVEDCNCDVCSGAGPDGWTCDVGDAVEAADRDVPGLAPPAATEAGS